MADSSKYADSHANPNGPGDARPTAMCIIEDEGLVGKLAGKVIFITGCSSGIGVETARALLATGAHLFITARDMAKGTKVVEELLAGAGPGHGKVDLLKLELDSLESVRECAAGFLSKSQQLNILIANAGVMACPEGRTKDGFETQFGTNHLAHFLLFELLKPALLSSSTPEFPSRMVLLSSGGHRMSHVRLDDLDLKKMGYDPWIAYGQSKTANIHMATEIERRYGAQGLHAFAVHPGGIRTSLLRHMGEDSIKSTFPAELEPKIKSPEQGAATTVWAAVSKELEGRGGKYLEDCSVARPRGPGVPKVMDPGYSPYVYDVDTAKRLWDISLKMVGLESDAS